jgi:general stress protein 26
MTDQKVLDYLNKNRVGVLVTLLKDGTPHGAALHYSQKDNPLEIYFSTESTSRKCQALNNGKPGKASLVVGFSEEEWITLQMDGEIQAILDKNELKKVQEIHYTKHPNSEKFKNDPTTIFLKFTPGWFRYTDYNTKPSTIISSEESA